MIRTENDDINDELIYIGITDENRKIINKLIKEKIDKVYSFIFFL